MYISVLRTDSGVRPPSTCVALNKLYKVKCVVLPIVPPALESVLPYRDINMQSLSKAVNLKVNLAASWMLRGIVDFPLVLYHLVCHTVVSIGPREHRLLYRPDFTKHVVWCNEGSCGCEGGHFPRV